MNITPHVSHLPLATVVNQPTESLRRDNVQREIISQPAALSRSAAEKGVASEKEAAKNPGQVDEQINFAQIQKQAEKDDTTINENGRQNQQQGQDGREEESDSNSRAEDENSPEAVAEQKEIQELKSRDQEVRAHERAHDAVGGSYTSAPTYTYQIGPDGKRYAVGGEVSADFSTVPGDPRATIVKMQKLYSAALAPANPSAQDFRAAAKASQKILEAQSELRSDETEQKSRNSFEPREKLGEETATFEDNGQDFDEVVDQTLKSQDQIVPNRTQEIDQRAERIADFYSAITLAYDKPPANNFSLTA